MKTLIFFCLALPTLAAGEPDSTIRRYQGTIGDDLAVTAIISSRPNDSGVLVHGGSYYYRKTGIPLDLGEPEPGKAGPTVFRENEHVRGEDIAFSGIWSVAIDGETITGTWTNADKQKPLPIRLEESYPGGSVRMKVHRFKNYWKSERAGKTAGENFSVEVIQLQGRGPGISRVNTELLKIAWPVGDENEPDKAPEVTLETLAKACEVRAPDEIDWDNTHVGTFDFSMEVNMNEFGFLSIGKRYYSFQGGAHGEYGVRHSSFDMTTGDALVLQDIAVEGSLARWEKLAHARLRAEIGVKPDGSLRAAGFYKDTPELTDNWFLTPGGIGFSYDPYEIAPYSQGIVRFILPWKDIAKDLKPGTRVAELAAEYTAKEKK